MRVTPGKLLASLAGAPRWVVGGVIIAVFAADALTHAFTLPLIPKLEAIAYDARLAATSPGTGDPQVVIVDIDEASLAREGRWPWSRDKIAKLVTQLFDHYHAHAVGFDVVFAEPDTSSGANVIDRLAATTFANTPGFRTRWDALRPSLDYDATLAAALAGKPVVLGFGFDDSTHKSGLLPAPAFTTAALGDHVIPLAQERGYTANLASLTRAAAASGHIDPAFDVDNVVRRVPMVKRYGDGYYPALPLALAAVAVEAKSIMPRFDSNGDLSAFDAGGLIVPVAADGLALVPYRGPPRTFHYESAADILDGSSRVTGIDGAIVLVGTTAKGLQDLRSTPFSPDFPGVELHANLLSGMLNGDMISVPRGAREVETLVIVVAGLLVVFLIPWRRPWITTMGVGGLALAVIALNFWFWIHDKSVIALARTLAILLTLWLYNLLTGFVKEAQQSRLISGMFRQYVPPERVTEMVESGESFSLDSESRELTVMFSDVRQFTALSERLSPRELSAMMNVYLTSMTEAIHRSRGTIDKYIGDAIMAFWGAPLAISEHAHEAVAAAIAMRDTMPTLSPVFAARGWPELHIGVGINTGMMNVGDMGSRFRQAYTVLGDAVNLASRIEGLTKVYGVTILCGQATRDAAPAFTWREVDLVRVVNHEAPIAIWEPLGTAVASNAAARLARWNEALQRYRARDFEAAIEIFAALEDEDVSTTLYTLFVDRCHRFIASPPPADWDGATNMTQK
ncbi:MAG TPA: adenylate/guanylate cyclase domain-containing protein [Casimicrobiaceae bacterium]